METSDVQRFLALKQATELLLAAGQPPRVRLKDGIHDLDLPPLDARALEEVVRPLFKDAQWSEFQRTGGIRRESEWVHHRSPVHIRISRNRITLSCGQPA